MFMLEMVIEEEENMLCAVVLAVCIHGIQMKTNKGDNNVSGIIKMNMYTFFSIK